MTGWFLALAGVYLDALVIATVRARRPIRNADDYMMAGSDIGVVLGSLTVAATLFSTFTLLGMPDFFRTHGVAAWIFLGVADAVLAFVILWFGVHLRRRARQHGFKGLAGLMQACYETRWAGYLYMAGVFVFLIPYVAIQIRGVSIFLNATFPDFLPMWGWATAMVAIMLTYSEIGGLKAIIYADAIQGVILLAVTMIIAYGCVQNFGGVTAMFESVRATNAALLSAPGPGGLFTAQFLFASFLVFALIPVTQPQVAIRLVIMHNLAAMRRMAVTIGVFAMLVIGATIPIGMYGAVRYADLPTAEFLARVLILDQLPIIGAAVAIGLIAAAISTADSQLFAVGAELRSLMSGDEQRNMRRTKLAIFCFALTALIVALRSSDQLVLLARVTFAGTGLLAPFIIAAVLSQRSPGKEVIILTAAALIVFMCSLFGVLPAQLGALRVDLLLLLTLSAFTVLAAGWRHKMAAPAG